MDKQSPRCFGETGARLGDANLAARYWEAARFALLALAKSLSLSRDVAAAVVDNY